MTTPPVSPPIFSMVTLENGEILPRGLPVEEDAQHSVEEQDPTPLAPLSLQAVTEQTLLETLRLDLYAIERPPEDPNLLTRRTDERKQYVPCESGCGSSSSSSNTTSFSCSEQSASDEDRTSPPLSSSSCSSSPVDEPFTLPRCGSSSPSTFTSSPSRTFSGSSIVLNPLFRGRMELNLDTMAAACPILLTMGDDKKFQPAEAAYEIAKCICFKDGDLFLKNVLPELFKKVANPKKHSQWDQLFAHLLFYPQCADFLRSYFPTEEISYDVFAKSVVPYFMQMKISAHDILYILSNHTQKDLVHEGSGTLFRESSLSSSLCKEYGLLLLEPQLSALKEKLAHYIHASGANKLCLNRKIIVELLEKNEEGFIHLNAEEKEKAIQLELSRNSECSEGYFRVMLVMLYQLQLSSECKGLLEMRKCQIAQKLQLDPEDPSLTTYVGEVLFLRIINPYLLREFKDPLYQHAVTNLTKMIQNLTNKVRFGSDKPDPIFQNFNGIFDDFLQTHQDFIRMNSTTG